MEVLQPLFNAKTAALLFDSDRQGYEREVFRACVLGRPHLVIVNVTDDDDVFGCYVDRPLTLLNQWNPIGTLKVLTFALAGTCHAPQRFCQAREGYNGGLGVCLWDFSYLYTTYLFGVGDTARSVGWVSTTPEQWFPNLDRNAVFSNSHFVVKRVLAFQSDTFVSTYCASSVRFTVPRPATPECTTQ